MWTLLQNQKIYPFDRNEKSDFFEIWQQHKQLKTREMSEACPDISMRDMYINSNLNPLTKFTRSSRSTEFKDIFAWNISVMTTKTVSISTRIVISYVMKRGIPLWILWKVNGNWDNKMIRVSKQWKSHCRANTRVKREINPKKEDYENHSLGSE